MPSAIWTASIKAIDFMHGYLKDWEIWMDLAAPYTFRYEDLLTDYDSQVARLLEISAIG